MQGYRQLRQYRFFLNAAKVEEQELDSLIKNLKQQRSFSRAIRVGLRLFWSLMQGQTDVLLEEFPWVAEQFQRPFLDLQAQLERIEQKIPDPDQLALYRPTLPNSNTELQTTTQLQQTPTRLQATPSKTDADIGSTMEVKQALPTADKTTVSRYNMMLQMFGEGMVKLNELDTDVIEHGIAIGRIPKQEGAKILEVRRLKRLQQQETPPPKNKTPQQNTASGNAKPIVGANIELPPPEDDDIEL